MKRGGANFNRTLRGESPDELALQLGHALDQARVVSVDLFFLLGTWNTRAKLVHAAGGYQLTLPESVGLAGPDPDLPVPHPGLSGDDKGNLLLEYVAAGGSVAGLDFSGAVVPVGTDRV